MTTPTTKNAARKPQKPRSGAKLLDPSFPYTPAAKTDVQATWRRFGWKPRHEQKQP